MKLGLIFFILIFSVKAHSQSCDMYEIKDIPVYFYIVKNEKSTSKLNDSISYVIEKISERKFRVAKLQRGIVINNIIYSYKGKKRYQAFKVKKRKFGEVTIINERRMICLLEK